MMTDPIADMLTRIRNAGLARHDRTEVPASRMKEAVAKILKLEGYIADVRPSEGEGDKIEKHLHFKGEPKPAEGPKLAQIETT